MSPIGVYRAMLFSTLLVCLSGCFATRVKWREPIYPDPIVANDRCEPASAAERYYARAVRLEDACRASCVDAYFEAALLTTPQCDGCRNGRRRRLHDACLSKLVSAGQRFRRLDPSQHLTICRQGQKYRIAVTHHGFVWRDDQFKKLIPVGDYKTNALTHLHRYCGVGIPLVVRSCPEELLPREPVFAATMRLRITPSISDAEPTPLPEIAPNPFEDDAIEALPLPDADASRGRSTLSLASCERDGVEPVSIDEITLELHDPLRVTKVECNGAMRPLRRDLSAPLAYRLRDEGTTYLTNFINPMGIRNEGRLYMLEPHQPGKIPVVFVHGLLSDPFTWAEMINELRARPEFVKNYQTWVYEYTTGEAFVTAATTMRNQLAAALQRFDPHRNDAPLHQIVLVGHSMGGLVCKLQVTHSGDQLWQAAANRSLNSILVQEIQRQRLAEAFYFEPNPSVARVIFIGTPHRGSSAARQLTGRIASGLVNQPADARRLHNQLICCNPGVFTEEMGRRIPTSIDLMNPESKLLQAIEKLPIRNGVTLHSVVGDRFRILTCGRSDGLVPVESAVEPRAVTERIVNANHSRLNKAPESIEEVYCILNRHLESMNATGTVRAIAGSKGAASQNEWKGRIRWGDSTRQNIARAIYPGVPTIRNGIPLSPPSLGLERSARVGPTLHPTFNDLMPITGPRSLRGDRDVDPELVGQL